ncbi:MAG: hypothetical protein ABI577_07235 [bacterium]
MTLFKGTVGTTAVFVEVHISDESGDLIMAGQDLGGTVAEFFGKDEYEYFLSVPADQKDRLLLYLMQHVFGGRAETRTAIADWLDARQIPYSLHSF